MRPTRSALEQPAMAPSVRFPVHLPRATGLSAFIGEGFSWRKPKITQITTAGRDRTGRTGGQLRYLVPLVLRFVAGGSKRPLSTIAQPNRPPTTRVMPVSNLWSRPVS